MKDDTRKLLMIGGGIIVGAIILFLLFNVFGPRGAAPTPTVAPTIGVTSPIVGPVWEWTGTTDSAGKITTVSNPAQYTIQFQADNSYKGQADCNSISGTYVVSGSSLTINPGPATLVACPPGSLADQYTTQLLAAASYVMQGTELTINLKADAGSMHFRQQGAPSNAAVLIGPVWKWKQTQYNNGTNQIVPDPNQYTIQFSAEGRVQVKADCNSGSGVYTTGANNALTIQIQQLTRAACPPGSLSDQYIQQLNSTVSFFTGGADLVLNIQNDTAKMMFGSGEFPTAVPPAPIPTATLLATPIPSTITPTPPPACAGAPSIEFFVAEQPTIQQGQNTVLRWGKVLNANAVAIDQGIGGVAAPGSTIVAPNKTTTYTMTATGCGGTTQAVVTVTVVQPTPPPPTVAPTKVSPTGVPTQPPTNLPPTAVPTQAPTATPSPTSLPGADIIGVNWKWTGAALSDGTHYTPDDQNQYTLMLKPDGTVQVKADCNNASGTYQINGNALAIQLGAMTGAICPPGSLSDQYLQLLPQSESYLTQGNTLTIVLKQDTGTMTFSQ